MNQQIAPVNPRKTIRDVLEQQRSQIALALPQVVKIERFMRVALTCINKNPKLLACTQESLLACLMDCAALGIEPDGRRAHLIPYGDKCTLIIDYKGLAELVRRSGEVSDLHADVVCEKDEFDYVFGTGSFLRHRPNIREERGKVICAYSYVKLKDGSESFDVIGLNEIESVRKRSRAATNGPWVTDFAEMAKKTAFRRHSKWLPLSPEVQDQIRVDDEPLTEQERFAAAKGIDVVEPRAQFEPPPAIEEPPSQAEPQARPSPKRTRAAAAPSPTTPPAPDKPPENPMPAKAPPLQVVETLMKSVGIAEKDLLTQLFAQQIIEQGDTLAKLPDGILQDIIDNFESIAKAIKGEPKNEQGPFA